MTNPNPDKAASSRRQFQAKDGVGPGFKGLPSTSHRSQKSETRSRIFRELVHIAAEQGAAIELGVTTAGALQECLDRAVSLMRFASQAVDSLSYEVDPSQIASLSPDDDPLFDVFYNASGSAVIRPHRYLAMEREARIEVEKLAAMMTQLGIAERVVRVEEARAALVVAAIRDAAIEIGLPPDQVRLLGEALRRRVAEPSPTPGASDPALPHIRATFEGRNDERPILDAAFRAAKASEGDVLP